MTKIKLYIAIFGVVCSLAGLSALAEAATPAAADNSQVNNASELTADKAGNQQTDREIMQNIRKSVVADKSLSTYAKNVKIVAANGKVTLKGPVRSTDESNNIEDKAIQIAGIGNVTNELSVAPSP